MKNWLLLLLYWLFIFNVTSWLLKRNLKKFWEQCSHLIVNRTAMQQMCLLKILAYNYNISHRQGLSVIFSESCQLIRNRASSNLRTHQRLLSSPQIALKLGNPILKQLRRRFNNRARKLCCLLEDDGNFMGSFRIIPSFSFCVHSNDFCASLKSWIIEIATVELQFSLLSALERN